MKELTAVAIGVVIAPLFPAAMAGLTTFTSPTGGPELSTVLALFPVSYLAAGLVTMMFGLPVFLLWRMFGLVRWWSAVLSGFVVGGLISCLLQWPLFHGWPNPYLNIVIYGVTGSLSAVAFFFMWNKHDLNESIEHELR